MYIHLMSIYCIESSMISNLMYALYFTIYKYEICISMLSYVHIRIDSQRLNHIFCSRWNGLGVCAIIIKYQWNYIEIEKGWKRSTPSEEVEFNWRNNRVLVKASGTAPSPIAGSMRPRNTENGNWTIPETLSSHCQHEKHNILQKTAKDWQS